jgi:hypothetical protein
MCIVQEYDHCRDFVSLSHTHQDYIIKFLFFYFQQVLAI